METKTFTIYGHWVYESKLTNRRALLLAVRDFAIKSSNLIRMYYNPEDLRLETGVYSLFEKNYSIPGWIDKGYAVIGKCNSEDDRQEYGMYDCIRECLNYLNPLEDDKIHEILGAGEFPFLSVYEYKDDTSGKYHYIYTIGR